MMPEAPENIGDLYRLDGYPVTGMSTYARAYPGPDPRRKGYVTWWLEADDGDQYLWTGIEDHADSVTLIRRNGNP